MLNIGWVKNNRLRWSRQRRLIKNNEGAKNEFLSILKYTLRVFGVAFIFIIPMMKLDPLGGWA